MIIWPHIGMAGEFSPCESGSLAAINRNFKILDVLVQMAAKGIVEDLPLSPDEGDVYLTPTSVAMWDGTEWFEIPAKEGFLGYYDGQFYYYDENGDWVDLFSGNPILLEIILRLKRATSTGVLSGMGLSVNADPTKFNIASGIYEIADLSDINNPIVTTIEYAGTLANTVTNLATQEVTYILMDVSGNIIQSASFPTPNQRRQYAFIGRLNHANVTNISFADTFPDIKTSPIASFYDLVDALAPFKMDQGLLLTPNGANLSFNKSAGKVFFRSDNYLSDPNNPHTKTFGAQTPQSLRKMTQTTTTDVADVTVIDPTMYDVGGVATLIPGGVNLATIQRVFQYKSGAVRVAYGQQIYNNIGAAQEALFNDPFVANPTIEQTAVLIGFIIVRKGATLLNNTGHAVFIPATRFGGVGGGGGGGAGGGAIEISSTQTLTNGATAVLQDVIRQRIRVQGSGGDVKFLLPNGTRSAQEIFILGMSDSAPTQLEDSANVYSNGTVTYNNKTQKQYIWDEIENIWIITGGN